MATTVRRAGSLEQRQWNAAATRFVLLNVAGGTAVLASYAWGLAHLGNEASRAWGGVPDSLRPVYQLSMLLAAAGYFPMTLFVLGRLRSSRESSTGMARAATGLYAAILVCSALWLPLTCAMLETPSAALWWTIRLDLAIVGMSSLALLGLLLQRRPASASLAWKAAVAGAIAFCLQTALLDAIVWPAYFSAGR